MALRVGAEVSLVVRAGRAVYRGEKRDLPERVDIYDRRAARLAEALEVRKSYGRKVRDRRAGSRNHLQLTVRLGDPDALVNSAGIEAGAKCDRSVRAHNRAGKAIEFVIRHAGRAHSHANDE